MKTIESLLAATDLSLAGDHAVRRAALLAQALGARLHILHVLRPTRGWFTPAAGPELQAVQARAALQRLAVEISCSLDLSPTVEVGVGPLHEVLQHAAARADLAVIGRRRGLARPLAGRLAERLLTAGPVLVVRTPADRSYRQLLVPTDFTPASAAALRLAARLRGAACLQVLHALDARRDAVLRDADVPEHVVREARQMDEARAGARLRRQATEQGLDVPSMRFVLADGAPVPATLRTARRHGADLIVAGRRRRSTLAGLLGGRVGGRLLAAADCDVLLVPEAADRPAPVSATPVAPPRPDHWIHHTARFGARRAR